MAPDPSDRQDRKPDTGTDAATQSAVDQEPSFQSTDDRSQHQEKAHRLGELRTDMKLLIEGPTEAESIHTVVSTTLQQARDLFENLPARLNKPGSDKTAAGELDTVTCDPQVDKEWVESS